MSLVPPLHQMVSIWNMEKVDGPLQADLWCGYETLPDAAGGRHVNLIPTMGHMSYGYLLSF